MADDPTQEQIEEVGNALASGRKIEAIKIYREASGKGLKEAKEFVEALIPQLKEQDPEKYAKLSSQGAGCASVILFCVALTAGSAAWIITSLA